MDALRSAVPLARLLVVVAEARRNVVVRVRSRARSASIHVAGGQIQLLEGVDGEPLGDTLLRLGALDTGRHRDALHGAPPAGKVGPWLVAVGAAQECAVQAALEAQLGARVANLLRWPDALFELVPATPAPANGCEARADLTWAVWEGLNALARELPAATLAALSGDVALQLTRSGVRLLEALGAADVMLDVPAVLRATPRAELRAPRAVLRVLGAASEAMFDNDSCTLLLRKQREIRRRAGARALLDLPPHARAEQARPALRRLASKLHPDRFHTADPSLRAVSSEVMRALSQAEHELLGSSR